VLVEAGWTKSRLLVVLVAVTLDEAEVPENLKAVATLEGAAAALGDVSEMSPDEELVVVRVDVPLPVSSLLLSSSSTSLPPLSESEDSPVKGTDRI
jgi:hypothetical protein